MKFSNGITCEDEQIKFNTILDPNYSVEEHKLNGGILVGNQFGGKKASITKFKKAIKEKITVKKTITVKELASKIKTTVYFVNRFLNGESLPEDVALKIYVFQQFYVFDNAKKPTKKERKNQTFNNSNGKNKAITRDLKINAWIKTNLKKGRILCLPHDDLITELLTAKVFPNNFEYEAVECEDKTYFEMLQTIANEKLNMSAKKGFIGDVLYRALTDDFLHLDLDYCGTFSKYKDEVKHAIQNNLVEVNGTISLTFFKGHDGKTCDYLNNKFPSIVKDSFNLCDTEMGILFALTQMDINNNYVIEEFYPYLDVEADQNGKIDGRTGSPMVLIILRRIK